MTLQQQITNNVTFTYITNLTQAKTAGVLHARPVDEVFVRDVMGLPAVDIATLKKDGTYLVPTLYLTDWHREHAAEAHLPDFAKKKMELVSEVGKANVKKAIAAGVKIGMGTDAAVYPHGLNAHELAVYVSLGMSPLQAIQTATINDADLLGWSDKVGTLEPGKWADIIAVDGNPLDDITTLQRVKFVIKGGEVVKSDYAK